MLAALVQLVFVPLSTLFGGSAEVSGVEPVIDTQPVELTTCGGAPVSLRCKALGEDLNYRWQMEVIPRLWVDVVSDPEPRPFSRFIITANPDGSSSLAFGGLGLTESTRYRCVIENPAGSVTTDQVRATALAGDVGTTGGVLGGDFVTDANDMIVYIDAFFNAEIWADMGKPGGEPGGDGTHDSNDFVVYIDQFFEPCYILHAPLPVPGPPLVPAPELR